MVIMGRSMSRMRRRAGPYSRFFSRLKKLASRRQLPSCARLGRAGGPGPPPAPASQIPTILIIEDEAKMRRLLELNLGDDGFKTLSAGDAETGLKLLASEPVHLVLTDLKLP